MLFKARFWGVRKKKGRGEAQSFGISKRSAGEDAEVLQAIDRIATTAKQSNSWRICMGIRKIGKDCVCERFNWFYLMLFNGSLMKLWNLRKVFVTNLFTGLHSTGVTKDEGVGKGAETFTRWS